MDGHGAATNRCGISGTDRDRGPGCRSAAPEARNEPTGGVNEVEVTDLVVVSDAPVHTGESAEIVVDLAPVAPTTTTRPWLLGAFDPVELRKFRGVLGPVKRGFDLVAASALLVVLAPLLLLVAAAIKLHDRGPVLYRQSRVGFEGVPFELLKFRSMVEDAEHQIIDLTDHNLTDGLLFKVDEDPRVTRVGRLIRRLSIDELPQLLNVIRGDMSLVGPRPLAAEPEDFSPRANLRHCVRPGITGFWQVSGGNGLTYKEMIDLDLTYIREHSLMLDTRLLFRTVPALLDRSRPC